MAHRRGHLFFHAFQWSLLILIFAGLLGIKVQAKEALEPYASLDTEICKPDIPGMVGYWPMDDGANAPPFLELIDPDGLHHATCDEGKCPESTSGKIGGAFNFVYDEVALGGDEVSAPNFAGFNWAGNSSFSMEAWVKLPSTLNCDGLENHKVFVGRRAGAISLWLGCGDGNKAAFYLRDSLMNLSIASSVDPITDDQWHHVVGVRDGTTGETLVYVDGTPGEPDVLMFDGTFSKNVKLDIGWFNTTPFYWLTGLLDEIALYDRAITADEVALHYSDGQGQSYCNAAPVITPVDAQNSNEGDSLTLTFTASDLEGHDFTFAATNYPPGLVFDPVTQKLGGTISYQAHVSPDPYNVTITAMETGSGGMTGTMSFNWTVNDVNRAPVVTNPGTQDSVEGQVINLQIVANDPDTDNTLIFSAENLPPGLSIDPSTGVIGGSISYSAGAISSYLVKVTVSDDAEFSDHVSLPVETAFTWKVGETNLQIYLPIVINGDQP